MEYAELFTIVDDYKRLRDRCSVQEDIISTLQAANRGLLNRVGRLEKEIKIFKKEES
jgi:pyoverdine/dityrosine biosynthesis protein Dit1